MLATAWLFLAPDRWLGSLIPTHTAGTAFNLGLLAELRVSLALLGLLCLALGLFPQVLYRLAERLAAPLAAAEQVAAQRQALAGPPAGEHRGYRSSVRRLQHRPPCCV